MGGAGEVWHLGNGPAFALPSRRFEEMILRRGRERNAWPEWDDSNGLQWPITFRKTEIEALSKIRVRLKSTSVEKGIEYRGCR